MRQVKHLHSQLNATLALFCILNTEHSLVKENVVAQYIWMAITLEPEFMNGVEGRVCFKPSHTEQQLPVTYP